MRKSGPSPEILQDEMSRRRSLIRRQLWEVIGSALPNINGKDYTFLEFIEDAEVFETDSIENGGYLNKVDCEVCYKISEILASLVDETAYAMHNIIDSI